MAQGQNRQQQGQRELRTPAPALALARLPTLRTGERKEGTTGVGGTAWKVALVPETGRLERVPQGLSLWATLQVKVLRGRSCLMSG